MTISTVNLTAPSLASMAVLLAAMLACCALEAAEPPAGGDMGKKVTYQDHVRPILREHCFACHSQDDASSGLALDDFAATLAGGAGGEVLAAGDVDGSRLWRLINHDEEPVMPPGDKMPAEQLLVIKQWIEGGLLDNASSKAKKSKRSAIGQMKVTADNRPQGEPAMPQGWFRQPVLASPRVGPITTLAASPWAPVVAVPWQRQVSLYHTEQQQLVGVLPYVEGVPNVVRFSRDGSLLLVAGGQDASSGSATVFDVKSGDRLATVGDELDTVLAADISPDHSLVAIGGPKKKVRVYHTSDGSLAYELGKHTDWVTAIEFSPNGKLLATADRGAGLLVWQAAAGNPRGDLRGHKKSVTAISWRADSNMLASASEDGEVRLWRQDGQAIRNFRAHAPGATSVIFARDGRLVTTGRDRRVTIWSTEGKALKQCEPMGDITLAAAFTADDLRVVASDFSGTVNIFDIASGKPVGQLQANPPTLADRLVLAEKKKQEAASKLDSAVANVKQGEQQLAMANEAHATFNKQMANATTAVTDAKKKRQTDEQELGKSRQSMATEEKSQATAVEIRKVAEQALASANEQLAKGTPEGQPAPAPDAEASNVLKSLQEAVQHAQQAEQTRTKQLTDAKAKAGAAEQTFQQASNMLAQAEKNLAAVSSQRTGLPDLNAAQVAVKTSTAAAAEVKQRIAATQQHALALAEEKTAYEQAVTRLAQETQTKNSQRDQLAAEVEKAKVEQVAALAKQAEQQTALDKLSQQLAALTEELNRQKSDHQKSAQLIEQLKQRGDELGQKVAAAEAAAERAATRHATFAAAEETRAKLLGK